MSREIKFRAWQSVLKIMDYSPHNSISFDGKIVNFGNADITGFHDNVMQFTGFLDKAGAEIYEGDIVLYPNDEDENSPFIMKVVFGDGAFRAIDVKNWKAWVKKYPNDEALLSMGINEIEIIGNVFQNPELLK